MISLLGKTAFHLLGWKLVGTYPGNKKSFVMIVAPHTSNWDVPLGLYVKFWIKMKIKFYVKSELFTPPLGWLLKWSGALPIVRSRSTNFVRQVVNDFKTKKSHRIIITPEGTRKKVRKFKTGFYHIANVAQVPILPVIFDYTRKEVIFKNLFYPTRNSEKDIAEIEMIYDGIVGKVPEFSFKRIQA